MRLELTAFTRRGAALAARLAEELTRRGHQAACTRDGLKADAWAARAFSHSEGLIFVGATGIAIRAIAPHLRHKSTDPAVVVVDEGGQFVIPILIAGTRVDGGIEFIKNLVEKEVNPEIKQNAVRSLGAAPIDKLPAIVDDAFSHGTVQNLSPFFHGTSETPENSAFMWTYLKDNFKMLVSRFGTTAFLLPTLLSCATRFFATEALAADVEQFAAQNKGTILDRPFAVQAEEIRTKASVAQKQAEAMKAALAQ